MAHEFRVGNCVILVSPLDGNNCERIGLKGKVTKLDADRVTVEWEVGYTGTYEKWRLTMMPVTDK